MKQETAGSGRLAPPFAQTAVASGREISLATFAGAPLLLMFVDYRGASTVRPVLRSVREREADHRRLGAAVVVDLAAVPRLLRSVATGAMEAAYQQAALEIPDGHDPADHLLLLPDWQGSISRAYGVTPGVVTLVLVDAGGRIASRYEGADAVGGAGQLLAQVGY